VSTIARRPAVSPDSNARPRARLGAWWRLARPFTLLAPALGMASGGIVAWYAAGDRLTDGNTFLALLLAGSLAAALLNAASNTLNQLCDLDVDRINKPGRPLVTGEVSAAGAWVFTFATAAAAIALAAWISQVTGHWATLLLFAAAAVSSWAYSAAPLRMKARGWLANATVALPRGVLLKVAGWSLAQSVLSLEAWYIGGIFGLFLLGATTTKDYADVRGDAAKGVRTLPVRHGAAGAARRTTPLMVLPFPLIPLGGLIGVLSAPLVDLLFLGGIATLWGAYIAAIVHADPDDLTRTENHPAWWHMYLLMVFLQVGFAVAYIPRAELFSWLGVA
jgi:4-hydroxybenzoate polyprenyltransferase